MSAAPFLARVTAVLPGTVADLLTVEPLPGEAYRGVRPTWREARAPRVGEIVCCRYVEHADGATWFAEPIPETARVTA